MQLQCQKDFYDVLYAIDKNDKNFSILHIVYGAVLGGLMHKPLTIVLRNNL